MSSLSLERVWKIYDGEIVALRDASFGANDGEFIALLGPSGCGKSSTMRMIAGLESISRGRIRFDSNIVNDLSPAQRNVALAFESYALYSPLTVRENLEFPLRSRGMAKTEIDRRVSKSILTFQIESLLDRRPSELSGGQAQRVSIARALVRNPNMILLDEPLSHLDYRLRSDIRVRIRRIHDELEATTVYITHDQEEAVALADRIIVMNHAEIQQIGDVAALWSRPVNRFVAGFLGDPAMNFVDVEFHDGKAVCQAGQMSSLAMIQHDGKSKFILGFRPEETMINVATGTGEGFFGEVSVNEFHGERCVLTIETANGQMKVVDGRASPWRPGDKISLTVDSRKSHIFCSQTGVALQHGGETA